MWLMEPMLGTPCDPKECLSTCPVLEMIRQYWCSPPDPSRSLGDLRRQEDRILTRTRRRYQGPASLAMRPGALALAGNSRRGQSVTLTTDPLSDRYAVLTTILRYDDRAILTGSSRSDLQTILRFDSVVSPDIQEYNRNRLRSLLQTAIG